MLLVSNIGRKLDARLLGATFGLDVAVADVTLSPTVRFLSELLFFDHLIGSLGAEARGRPRFVRDWHLEAIPALNYESAVGHVAEVEVALAMWPLLIL